MSEALPDPAAAAGPAAPRRAPCRAEPSACERPLEKREPMGTGRGGGVNSKMVTE